MKKRKFRLGAIQPKREHWLTDECHRITQGDADKALAGHEGPWDLWFRSRGEALFAYDLVACETRALIRYWWYEPARFHHPRPWPKRGYKPDFMVLLWDGSLRFYEVKGKAPEQRKAGELMRERFEKAGLPELVVITPGTPPVEMRA